MLNSSDILRGYTDTIILAQLAAGDSYGYVISKNVQEITRGELQLKEATLYTTFRRLENAGMIESYWGNENAGARRRYYHLTDAGRKLYEENRADWRKYRAMISELFGMEDRTT
ncbi:MAG TPA: helix-turn-helix transcriptional regulator [Candidatus Ventricola intestinavium]|nr:helix-turn-helix transcriptional regulator [Candidatus Ventricola intestinavium]